MWKKMIGLAVAAGLVAGMAAIPVVAADPAVIPTENLALWVKADDASSFELATDGSNKVERWKDLSGKGNDLVPVTEVSADKEARPVLTQNAINGLPAVEFDGDSTGLTTGAFAEAYEGASAIFIVARILENNPTNPTFRGFFNTSAGMQKDHDIDTYLLFNNTINNQIQNRSYLGSANFSRPWVQDNTVGVDDGVARVFSMSIQEQNYPDDGGLGMHVLAETSSSDGTTISQKNGMNTDVKPTTNPFAKFNKHYGYTVGNRMSGNSYNGRSINAQIAEIIVYQGDMGRNSGDSDYLKIRTYLENKYLMEPEPAPLTIDATVDDTVTSAKKVTATVTGTYEGTFDVVAQVYADAEMTQPLLYMSQTVETGAELNFCVAPDNYIKIMATTKFNDPTDAGEVLADPVTK